MNKEKLAKQRTLNGEHFQETQFGRVRFFVSIFISVSSHLILLCFCTAIPSAVIPVCVYLLLLSAVTYLTYLMTFFN